MKRALKKFNGFKNKIKIDGQKIFDYNDKTLFVKKVTLNQYQLHLHQY